MWKPIFLKFGMVLLVVAVAAAGVVTLRWLTSDPLLETADVVNLEDEWANTIRKIGIEPVFPPEEDLTVGDVLAVVVKDNKPDADGDAKITAQTPLPKRAIKLAHVDTRKALTDSYGLLPVFIAPASILLPPVKPPAADNATAAKEAADDKTPATKQAPEVKVTLPGVVRNFMAETNQGDLPRAAFPKLKIQGSSNATGGLGAAFGGFFGYGTDNRGLEELFLTEVRTYGLPSTDAEELLKAFCTAEKTKHACSDITARKQLERIVGDDKEGKPRVHQKYVSDKKGNQRYRIRIDIVMVNRVYLARAIRNLNQSGVAEGARLSVTVQPSTQAAAGGSAAGAPPGTANADRADIDAIRKRLEEIEKPSSGSTGGSAVYGRSRDREALLNEAFDRPVAIGYRSVRLMPDGDDEAE